MNLIEMDGFLRGNGLPGDMKVNETNAEYLVRKLAALEQQLAESQREFRAADATIENLQMQVEKLAAENAGLKKFCKEAAFDADYEAELGMERGGFTDALNDIKTPATDAVLAEVRAQGADECVRQLVISDDDDFLDAPNVCAMVAHQLRQGGAV